MSREQLEEFITNYLQIEPDITDDEIMKVVQKARKNAWLASIPQYKPIHVENKKEIQSAFQERRKKVQRKRFKDESTQDY